MTRRLPRTSLTASEAAIIKNVQTSAQVAGVSSIEIENVTGLQAALDAKAASSHTHAQSDITSMADLPLEQLMQMQVTTASRYEQTALEAVRALLRA